MIGFFYEMKKEKQIHQFADSLLNWHETIDRQMPWKETEDPYAIWISEIILQQTRVSQGTNYYINFIRKFPNVSSLASAPLKEVLKAWEGLGYYSRAKNLHLAAQDIMERFDGLFPNSYEDIISLKGIGPYTAAAITSFAFDLPYPVIDGNVQRVISRIFGITSAIDSKEGETEVKNLANKLLHTKNPADYNQAIMDFGALVCTPRTPKCKTCILSNQCIAFKENLINQIPYKAKKIKVTEGHLYFFLLKVKDKIAIQQRLQNGIWANLFELPSLELSSKINANEFFEKAKKQGVIPKKLLYSTEHKLTHRKLFINIYKADIINNTKLSKKLRFEKISELSTFAFPKPLRSFLDSIELENI